MGRLSPNIVVNHLLHLKKFNPRGVAVVHGRERITWKELADRAFRIASALGRLGVSRGDKVAFMFHNCPRFIEVNYGIQAAGAIPVPVNYRFAGREIAYQVTHSDAAVFIYDCLWEKSVSEGLGGLTKNPVLVCDGGTAPPGVMAFHDFTAQGNGLIPAVETGLDDAAAMIYTGGTTGFPKGVLLSYRAHVDMHAALFSNLITRIASMDIAFPKLKAVAKAIPIPGADAALNLARLKPVKQVAGSPQATKILETVLKTIMTRPELARFIYKNPLDFMIPSMPLFHDASYQLLMLALTLGNVRFILVPGARFDSREVFKTIEREKPFFMANVPAGWKMLVSSPSASRYDVRSVRLSATGAGVAYPELKREILRCFPETLVLDMFGQTEMTPVTTFRIDADPETLKDRSVGRSIVDVKIVDDRGKEVTKGETGEILYRSKTVMMGYYKDSEKTGEAMAGGWFKSGDLGYMDTDGELRLVDRKKECINTGGEKVYPMEVEEILHEHPAVDGVCVIGVPDPVWGSSIRAVVVPKHGKEVKGDDLREFCRGRLAGYKIPRSVVIAGELPLSPVGKILRAKIRDLYGEP
jgi:acyl-CoA synthetase (AMP-forming)/AMP-acid ligase II